MDTSLRMKIRSIPVFVSRLTGITNVLVAAAPCVAEVTREAVRFVGALPVVDHNAAFDRKLWQAEWQRLSLDTATPFACTMLLARRRYPSIRATSSAPWWRRGSCPDPAAPTARWWTPRWRGDWSERSGCEGSKISSRRSRPGSSGSQA